MGRLDTGQGCRRRDSFKIVEPLHILDQGVFSAKTRLRTRPDNLVGTLLCAAWARWAKLGVIISSTTGDGEQPENVIKFWRKLRPKSLECDYLAHMSYTILGLGDTNYNNFCNAPKALHRRLTELGARTFYPPDWADDGTGLEIVVEPWLENLWEAVEKLC